jgi:hypothetical protein
MCRDLPFTYLRRDMETIHVVTTPEKHRTELDVEMTTCRLGDKWYWRLDEGDDIEICRCETANGPHVVTGRGFVTKAVYGPFCDMPDAWTEKNHSLGSNRSMAELAKAMKSAYGDQFDETSLVTVIFYKRTENF